RVTFLSSSTRLHLHPFPTRRSSDLPGEARPWRLESYACLFGRASGFYHRETDPWPHQRIQLTRPITARGGERDRSCTVADPQPVDRKSTRLNSSHGSISYAVFCLKK